MSFWKALSVLWLCNGPRWREQLLCISCGRGRGGRAGSRAPRAAAPAGPSVLELYYIIIVFRRRLAGSNIFVKFTIFRNDFLVSKIFR